MDPGYGTSSARYDDPRHGAAMPVVRAFDLAESLICAHCIPSLYGFC
jgi:hypothetical protein